MQNKKTLIHVKEVMELKANIDWVKKLTSRKFWLSLATFVSMMMVYCGSSQSKADQTVALIMAGASVVAYIIGEGLADAANIKPEEGKEEK